MTFLLHYLENIGLRHSDEIPASNHKETCTGVKKKVTGIVAQSTVLDRPFRFGLLLLLTGCKVQGDLTACRITEWVLGGSVAGAGRVCC